MRLRACLQAFLGSATMSDLATSDEEEIILADLDDDELVQQMHDDLY